MRARSFFFAATFGLWTWSAAAQPAPAAAQPAPAATASDEADRLFREANKLYNDKKYAEAEAVYEQALAKKPAHDIAANLGYAELKQNKLVEAAEHVAFAVRAWPPTGKEENRRSAEEQLLKLRAELVTVTYEVNVPDARVVVNGRGATPPGGAPERFALPGRVSIRAERDGYVAAETVIDTAAKGSSHRIKLTLTAAPPPVPTGSSTTTASSLPTSIPPPSGHPRTELIVAGGVLSGVAVVVGAVLLGTGESMRASLIADAPKNPDGSLVCGKQTLPGTEIAMCEDLRSRGNEATALGRTGIGLLAGGGVLGLVTAGYALFWPRAPKPTGSAVTPVVTPTHAGLVWSGSF